MNISATPVLDPREADDVARELLGRLPGYVPGWQLAPAGPGWALIHVVARYARTLIERLNQAPEKNKLAFLDLLGITLLPAEAARAAVVFEAIPQIGDGRVPVRTRVGAKVAGRADPLVFETENAIALSSAQLSEVVTLWPARDAYADHSTDAVAGRPFMLFEPLQPVSHVLYLAHDRVFDFNGDTRLEIQFDLAPRAKGSAPRSLPIVWEYWDERSWRPFAEFDPLDPKGGEDGTAGLTRSGVVRLSAACGKAAATTVDGVRAFWLRARLKEPLPPEPGALLPEVDRIRLRVLTERPLVHALDEGDSACAGDVKPDRAFADTTKLDVSKTFFPFGRAPGRDAAFYLSNEEALGKAGAEVTLCFRRVKTPEEEADEQEAAMREAKARKGIVHAAGMAVKVVVAAAQGVIDVVQHLGSLLGIPLPTALVQKQQDLQAASAALSAVDGIPAVATLAGDVTAMMTSDFQTLVSPMIPAILDEDTGFLTDPLTWRQFLFTALHLALSSASTAAERANELLDSLIELGRSMAAPGIPILLTAARDAGSAAAEAGRGALVIADLLQGTPQLPTVELPAKVAVVEAERDGLNEAADIADLAAAVTEMVQALKTDSETLLAGLVLWWFNSAGAVFDARTAAMAGGLVAIVNVTHDAAAQAIATLAPLTELGALEGAGTVDEESALDPPRLVWEYWDGSRWRTLLAPSDDEARNFAASGEISFVVPDDLEPVSVNDVAARWLRVRLASGTFNRIRMVTWPDSVSNTTNVMPILEARPPALEDPFLGYRYRSPWMAPERCLTRNDFVFEDHTAEAAWPGPPFQPFRPVADSFPALYLGFDRALPADLVSVFIDVEEAEDEASGPALAWEYWNETTWAELAVEDETRGLAVPGIVSMPWPGVPTPAAAAVVHASGTRVQLLESRQSARFQRGDRVYVAAGEAGELATVERSVQGVLILREPLGQDYSQATVDTAGLPRFGKPRTWIRARLKEDASPLRARIVGIHLNGVWAAQMQTVENEPLGASDGQPGQTFFLRQTPVLEGEAVEVRELMGPRAAVELPMLREELQRSGFTDVDLRTVPDLRTGRVKEVWVRWRLRPHLFFSGPTDRDVVIERTRGRLLFGDDVFGRIPPPGADVRALRYRAGGGLTGNVPARGIDQMLSGVPARGVKNPRGAEGGADGETVDGVRTRGPQVLRHRRQALSAADYEALACEASPGVAIARALPTTSATGLPRAGRVRLIIVPQSLDPQPQPSFELRRRVRDFLMARTPATLGGLAVAGPEYLPVGVEAAVTPRWRDDAGPVRDAVEAALAEFLHPLRGGPDASGWPFGRNVYLSDVAALLEGISGVDHVNTMSLLLDGTPRGEVVEVPPDRIVTAGWLQVTLAANEV